MSTSEHSAPGATRTTQITLVSGERHRVEGDPKTVERTILDAARGSLMQLAWLVDAETHDELAVNPKHVIALRGVPERNDV